MRYLIFAFLLFGCANQEKATEAAHNWAAQQQRLFGPGAKVAVMSCQPSDSDQNGYCSCDVVVQTSPNVAPTHPNIECACGWLQVITDGCKQKGYR